MPLKMEKTKNDNSRTALSVVLFMAFMLAFLMMAYFSMAGTMQRQFFTSPEEAVKALIGALESKDPKKLEVIFGPDSQDLLMSGDPVADQSGRDKFIKLYHEKYSLEKNGDKAVFVIGNNDWPFTIPIVKNEAGWFFDAEAGKEEILARRIGRNELRTIKVCLAYVDAQREYALKDRDGDGLLQYAEKFKSDKSKKNGLYWETENDEEQSPLGPLFAAAHEEGYSTKEGEGKPVPYYGYYYRILKRQGKDAPGGAYDYMARGKMIGGFALVAYPAKYSSSGIKTFIVNHRGVVFQKDLGQETEKEALAMTQFNPDNKWDKVE